MEDEVFGGAEPHKGLSRRVQKLEETANAQPGTSAGGVFSWFTKHSRQIQVNWHY